MFTDDCLKLIELKMENPTLNDIKKAYRKCAVKYHPDKGGTENKFKKIISAYQTLLKTFSETNIEHTSSFNYSEYFSGKKTEEKKKKTENKKEERYSEELRKRQKKWRKTVKKRMRARKFSF